MKRIGTMKKFGIALLASLNLGIALADTTPDANHLTSKADAFFTKEYIIDRQVLATALYFEERSSKASDEEIAQIGYVILNRVGSKHYPNTVYEVVYQPYQFSFTHDGKSETMFNTKARDRAFKIAEQVLDGTITNKVDNADHYLNRNISKATWWKKMKFKGRFHNHWFYKR